MTGRTFCGVILCCLYTVSLMIVPASGDLIAPAITHVYFEKDGLPYQGSVDYSVNCYGYSRLQSYAEKPAGSYQPELVFHYSATCKEYGCEIYQPYYLQYTHIDWCDLEGKTNGQSFSLQNFSVNPYTTCNGVRNRIEKTWGTRTESYYYTPEYVLCSNAGKNINPKWRAEQLTFSSTEVSRNSSSVILLPGRSPLYETGPYRFLYVNQSDVSMDLARYIQYLEICNPETDPKCGGWIIDGKPLKLYSEYRPLKNNATHLKDHPCDTFLVATDPSLIMPFTERDPWHHACAYEACNYTVQICESRFTIPSGNLSPVQDPFLGETPATEIPLMPMQSIPPSVQGNPVESLYCSIVEFLGGMCT